MWRPKLLDRKPAADCFFETILPREFFINSALPKPPGVFRAVPPYTSHFDPINFLKAIPK
jgi:hypothetical protein